MEDAENKDRIYRKHMKLKSAVAITTSNSISLKLAFSDNSRHAIRARELFATPPYACCRK